MKKDRTLSLAVIGLSVNILYGIYNATIGVISHSWWFIALSGYYIILSVMRFSVLRIEKGQKTELFAKKITGYMFIILSVTLLGTVYLAYIENRGISYHEIVMITIATYTFTKITLAIINLIKALKVNLPLIQTLRNISFAEALVSIFSLQRSMLTSFEGMSESDIKLFNLLTGSAVCIIIFFLGLNLIEGRKFIVAKSKIVKANEKIADTVVGGYKKIENAVVEGYTKIEDKFVDTYLTHDGESVEDAKKRLKKQ